VYRWLVTVALVAALLVVVATPVDAALTARHRRKPVVVTEQCASAMRAWKAVVDANGSDDAELAAVEASLRQCASPAEWLKAVAPYTGPELDDLVYTGRGNTAKQVLWADCGNGTDPAPACRRHR